LLGSAAVPGYPLVLDTEGVVLLGSEQTVDWEEVMRWKGDWLAGCYYPSDVVRDGTWTMVANKYTCDRPAPQADGPPVWAVDPTPAWDTVSPVVTYLGTGTRFVFTQAGWLNSWRVWIPTVSANNKYTATFYDVTDPAHVVEQSTTITPSVTGWYEVTVAPLLIVPGTEVIIVLYAQNDAGKAPHTGPWDYTGQTTLDNDPGVGNFNRNNGSTKLRINSTDQNALDRDGELAEIHPGVEMNVNDGEWVVRVDAVTDMTGWWLFDVTTQSGGLSAGADGVKPIFWEIASPQSTDYVKSDLYWNTNQPSWATTNGVYTEEPIDVSGFIATTLRTYVDAPSVAAIEDNTGYGADLNFTPASVSEDWDVVAVSEGGGTSSTASNDPFFNGTFRETFDGRAVSDGVNVTMTLEQTGGGDLTMRFSDGEAVLDTSPALSVALTAGSNESPTANYVYVPVSTKVVTVSTSSFPVEEHIKISYLLIPSAAFVLAHGAYVDQNWNDHLAGTDGQGHLSHMAERSRRLGAQYFSGIAGNGADNYLTIAGTTVYFSSAAGVIYQMHKHTFPAADTGAGDIVLVKNWDGDPYHELTNLYDIVADSNGDTIGPNRWFNIVVWGVANKSGEYEPLMVNVPSGTYQSEAAAVADALGYDDFTIPREFDLDSSTGFLICRITVQKEVNTWEYGSTLDLRGSNPQTATGSGSAAGGLFAENVFRVYDLNNINTAMQFVVGGSITPNVIRLYTAPDKDGTLALLSDIASSAWVAPTLLNGWVIYGAPQQTPRYRMDADGVVHIQGLVKDGTTTAGTVIFTLPSGFRPDAKLTMVVSAADSFGLLVIDPTGDVKCLTVSAAYTWLNVVFST